MINLRRQVAALMPDGICNALSDGTTFSYRLYDVLPKYVLQLEEGKFTQNSIAIAASESYTVPLPPNRDTSKRLCITIRSTARAKMVFNNGTTTSTALIKSTSGSLDGDHSGIYMFQDLATSLVLSVPATFATALIDYLIWEIPDLDDPASYRIGDMAFGYLVGDNA